MKWLLVVSLMLLGSCSAGNVAEPRVGFVENLSARMDAVDRLPLPAADIQGAMPTVGYLHAGRTRVTLSDLYVRGMVTSVDQGIGMRWNRGNDRITEVQLGFDDRGSQVQTVHLRIRSDVQIGAKGRLVDGPESVVVGVALSSPIDLKAVTRELLNREVAVLLVNSSPVFSYDLSLRSILQDGTYFGFVNGANVEFPVLRGDSRMPSVVSLSTLETSPVRDVNLD